MKAPTIAAALLLASLSAPAHGQALSGLRIDGPGEVIENGFALYSVIAEFDNGWEFDVTLDSFLWVEPGIYAEIGVFGDFYTFEVETDQVETINAFYSFGPDSETATLAVTITNEVEPTLVLERIRPCGPFVLTLSAPYPIDIADALRTYSRSGDALEVFLEGEIHASRAAPSFDFDGNLVLGQLFQNTVLVVSPSGEVVQTIGGGGLDGPTGTAIDAEGNIAVGSYFSDSVKFYDADGNYLGNLSHSGTEDPHCLAYDRAGNFFVGSRNNGNGRVAVFDDELNFLRYIGQGILVPHPIDMAFDKSENLWVTMPGSIHKFAHDGTLLDTLTHPDLEPTGIALDEHENLFVTNRFSHEVFVFSPDGDLLDRLPIDLGAEPDPSLELSGIAFAVGPDTDCNENETGDSCDIQSGLSEDCNTNGVPDECDIADGTSTDENGNGIPDECESLQHALGFDGVDDYVFVGGKDSLSLIAGFTLEAWIVPYDDSGFHRIISKGAPGVSGYGFGQFGRKLSFVSFGIYDHITMNDYLVTGQPVHVAVVFDYLSDAHFYVNGVFVETVTGSYPVNPSGDALNIGRNPSGSLEHWRGLIDEVRLWSVARTECEIQYSMHRPLSGLEPGLVGYWRFDEADGQYALDSSPYGNDGVLGDNDDSEGDDSDPAWVLSEADLSLPPSDPPYWTTPEFVPEVSSEHDWNVSVSQDGLEMYIASERDGFAESDIYRAERSSVNEPFSTPLVVRELSVPGYNNHDVGPHLSANGLRIYFMRHPAAISGDFYVAERDSPGAPWGQPVPIESLNTAGNEWALATSGDELSLVFSCDWSGEMRYWVGSRESVGDPWAGFALIDSLEGFAPDNCTLTPDGLTLYITAQGSSGLGGTDVWSLVRSSPSGSFREAVHIPELSSEQDEFDVSITNEGRTMYMVRPRNATRGDVFAAHLVVPGGPVEGELDCDGDIDLDDFGEFAACMTGPGGGVPEGCDRADYDQDGDVDLSDLGTLENLFTGAL